jgi:hypothetical protein
MDGSDIVANRLLRCARNDSSFLAEMGSGAVELLAMTLESRFVCEDCFAKDRLLMT